MNSVALPLCLVLLTLAPAAPTPGVRIVSPPAPSGTGTHDSPRSVRFGSATWHAGDGLHSESTFEGGVTMHFQVRGEEVESYERLSREKVVRDINVLSAGDQGPSRFSVRYAALEQSSKRTGIDDADEIETNPLSGRTFVLQRKGSDMAVLDDEDHDVSVPLAAQVRARELSRDGDFDHGIERLSTLLAAHPRTVGEKLDVPSDIALDLFPGDEPIDKARMCLTLVDVRAVDGVECAVFKAELSIEGGSEDPGYRLRFELSGEELFSVRDARFVGAELEGELELSGAVHGEGGAVETTGRGRVAIRELRHTTTSK